VELGIFGSVLWFLPIAPHCRPGCRKNLKNTLMRNKLKKLKPFLKKWGLPALMGLSLALWGIVTGNWGMVLLSAYLLGAFVLWAQRQARLATITAIVMIPTLDAKIEAISRWQDEAERHVIAEARAFEAEILDYNTEEQLFRQGRTAAGQPVRPPYSQLTIEIKRASGQPFNRVTLRDTGDFHKSFRVEWQATQFGITAGDTKTAKLVAKYGREIFGLDDAGQQELIGMIREPLADNLRKALEA